MDIVWEIAAWGTTAIVFTVALVAALPAFFRFVRGHGADVFPDFLKDKDTPARGKPS